VNARTCEFPRLSRGFSARSPGGHYAVLSCQENNFVMSRTAACDVLVAVCGTAPTILAKFKYGSPLA
jgi:hypothetical protein